MKRIFKLIALAICFLAACAPSSATPVKVTPTALALILPTDTSGATPASTEVRPYQIQRFATLAEAQQVARFTILEPTFIPDNLRLSDVWESDYADGTQQIGFAYTPAIPPQRQQEGKEIDINLAKTHRPLDMSVIVNNREPREVQVRGQKGYTWWLDSASAPYTGLAWREDSMNISIQLEGHWEDLVPNTSGPHGLDPFLIKIAESLQPLK